MNETASLAPPATAWPTEPGEQLRALRRERGESGEEFGAVIGLSKGKVSEMENGKFVPSVAVAVLVEELSGGRIDAADLNDDVRAARCAGCRADGVGIVHAQAPSTAGAAGS